ncbi:C4-dicarboxylate ABC transporter substrate-binding protein [Flavivirga aquatica]|uniref:C4-dicarboxylate ABC transporter substrate-binding protein n=1 Tax=Flavivirga aquatica TaxID=1849968 RepID=A0A1E5TCN9_9FLAO|nr:TRAP transporter substrate-binding protein [Flavivirga aquatica]OEK09121.1 C4-dicarboxylate ABC transporter substrate-binding protein [Flavivirga aquatica]
MTKFIYQSPVKQILNKSILIIIVVCFSACNNLQKQKTIKLAHGLDTNHPVHKAMIFMNNDLKKRSNGTMSIEIYPNQQLGNERQTLELLQIGSLGMTKVSAAVMENFSPNMKVFGLPFLFKNKAHLFNVLDGNIGKELLDGGQKYWLKGLGYYDSGSRSFYTKKAPVNTPNDLKGLKIRVMESPTAMTMVNSLGGAPTPISWGELYTSLQQGVVDGAENNPPSFYLSRHYEVCKYYSLDEHTSIPDVLIMGTHLWNDLNKQQQEWVQASVSASVKHQRILWAKAEQEALDAVKKAGVQITYPDKSKFQNKVTKMYENYKNEAEVYSLIQRIQKVK